MKYRIELEGDDVLDVLRCLECSGRTKTAVAVRDQYYAQLRASLRKLDDLGKGKKTAGFDEACRFMDGFFKEPK